LVCSSARSLSAGGTSSRVGSNGDNSLGSDISRCRSLRACTGTSVAASASTANLKDLTDSQVGATGIHAGVACKDICNRDAIASSNCGTSITRLDGDIATEVNGGRGGRGEESGNNGEED